MTLKRVVFPAPFGPMTLTISPSPTTSSSRLMQVSPPKAMETPFTSRTGVIRSPPAAFRRAPAGGPPSARRASRRSERSVDKDGAEHHSEQTAGAPENDHRIDGDQERNLDSRREDGALLRREEKP